MEENVLFYLEVSSFKTGGGGQSEFLTHLKRIYGLYVRAGSAREINISGDIRNSTTASVKSVLRAEGNSSFTGSVMSGGGDVDVDIDVDVGVLSDGCETSSASPCGLSRLDVDCFHGQDKDGVRDGAEGEEGRGGDENENERERGNEAIEGDGDGQGRAADDEDSGPDGTAAPAEAPAEAPGAGEETAPGAEVIVEGEKETETETASENERPGLEAQLEVGVTGVTGIRQDHAGTADSAGSSATQHPSGAASASASASPASGPDSLPPAVLPPRPPARAGTLQAVREQGHGPSNSNVSATASLGQEEVDGGEDAILRSASLTPAGVGVGVDETDVEDTMDEIRERRHSSGGMGIFAQFEGSWEYSNVHEVEGQGEFDVSVDIDELGLGIGPGGGYGDRTIFDLALLEVSDARRIVYDSFFVMAVALMYKRPTPLHMMQYGASVDSVSLNLSNVELGRCGTSAYLD